MGRVASAKRVLSRLTTVGVVLCGWVWASAAAELPAWGGNRKAPAQAQRMSFQCPQAYLGIREDLLPTYWKVLKGRRGLRLKSSQLQGQSMVCAYSAADGRTAGTVHRLVPEGYRCISDGVGNFRCRRVE